MEFWTKLIIILHILVALGIIGLVLLQHGKGADMGSGFGGGASGSLFGATGSANFLSRVTAVLATLFFILSLGLAYLATQKPNGGSVVLDAVKQPPASAEQKPASDIPQPSAIAPAEGAKAKDVPK